MATTISNNPHSDGNGSTRLNRSARSFWHKSAPKSVSQPYRSGNQADGWNAWTEYLANRTKPVALDRFLPGKASPLGWALPEEVIEADMPTTLDRIEATGSGSAAFQPGAEELMPVWCDSLDAGRPSIVNAYEALAWCHVLPRLADRVSADIWWAMLEHLIGLATEAEQIDLEADPLPHQLLWGELALTLAYLFPEITVCRKLTSTARVALSTGLVELLDGEGLPHGKHLVWLRPLLACWTRCRAMGETLAKSCFNGAARIQYEWLVRNALRLTRFDGTQMLEDGPAAAWCPELFEAAISFSGDEDDRDLGVLTLPGHRKADAKKIGRLALPDVSFHSEWSETALLRPGWPRSDPRLAVVYADRRVQIDLACRRDLLASGEWQLDVRIDGREVTPQSPWEEVCWLSDDDVDYLEIEASLSDGFRVQRQMLMAREDGFLLLADAIVPDAGQEDRLAKIEYRSCLPLVDSVDFQPEEETRECLLVGPKRAARVIPLALPEWRIDPRVGSLDRTEQGLELKQTIQGRGLFAPLFFDLSPRRTGRPLTWRQLTVAEDLEIQTPDVAAGFRMQAGKQQWLIYRSLTKPGNRTLLGHNLSSEMLVGRFDRDGEVNPLIEIE